MPWRPPTPTSSSRCHPTRRAAADVTDIGWMVEELRVSLFAQSLGTAGPVSEKRVRAAIAAVTASR